VSPSFFSKIAAALRIDATTVEHPVDSRSELDYHANMIVVGSNCFVLSDTGRTASVNPYNPEYAAKSIPIVDVPYCMRIQLLGRNIYLWPEMHCTFLP
jgi:hypothetical protein